LLIVPVVDPILCTVDALSSHEPFLVAHYDAGLLTWPSWVIWGLCHLWLAGKAVITLVLVPKEGRAVLRSWHAVHGMVAAEALAAHAALIWAGSHNVTLGVGFPSQALVP